MDRLKRLINDHEDWLIDRVVHYAHEHDYTRYTSTLREAWRASIVGLSEPLIAALDEMPLEGRPAGAPTRAAVEFGIAEARKHRGRGIDLALFLGLMKFYRRTYSDLVVEKVPDREERQMFTNILLEMFDSIEIGLVREWIDAGDNAQLNHLRAQNRDLSNEKNKYLTVFESIAEPAFLLDRNDTPLHVNAAGGRILMDETSPGASYYGQPDEERLRDLVGEILAQAEQGDPKSDRIVLDTPTGKRCFSIAIQEMLDISQKFAGRVIILNDVTDYLAAIAAAEEANRAKTSFLATVSHEIKTPINSIIGLTELLDDGKLGPDRHRHLEAIRTSGQLLSGLVENILGLSRSEANALQLNEQDFDLCELIGSIMQVVGPEAQTRGLSATCNIAPDVPCHVHGDAHKIRHVLMNLLSNALKFTAKGEVTVRVCLRDGTAPERPVIGFEVTDTGVGLPAGTNEWLFDPFTQYAHPELAPGPRGTGLGLAICKRFVTFLGGSISAAPRPGGGSVFSFELPLKAIATVPETADADTSLEVLVVEDDPVNALVAAGYVSDLGHKPVVANDYTAAVGALGTKKFDLVLTDNRLGGATGLDFARYLRRAKDPRLNTLPVIVVSAALPDAPGDLVDLVQHILEKPYDRQDLARAIRAACGTSTAPREERAPAEPAEAKAPEVPLFDPKVLNQLLTDLGIERCKRIVESYQSSAPRLFKALARGNMNGDLAAMSEAAHQLISAASFVGLTAIAAEARALHGCCTARDTRSARTVHSRLQALHAEGSEALTRHWHRTLENYGSPA